MTIYVKDRNYENELFGVLLYDNRNPEYAITITARYGKIDKTKSVLLHLSEGTVQKYNFETRKSEILKFDQYVINLSDNERVENNFKWKASERYLWELAGATDAKDQAELMEYKAEIHRRLTYPLFSIILAFIASSFILKGKFSRRISIINELQAIVTGVLFIVSIMTILNIVEKNIILAPLLYIDAAIFAFISIGLLKTKKVG
jgi:lipopolysaccharide export system permease protein